MPGYRKKTRAFLWGVVGLTCVQRGSGMLYDCLK